jgi:serine/threonine protein kinase
VSAEHQKLQELFAGALARENLEERERYLAEACLQNQELRQQVDSLLQAHSQAGDFLRQNVISPNLPPIGEGPGSDIGRYHLLQQIGEGGFGIVFMAEQQAPIRRQVALKIIKAGMDTREVVARFEAERQTLALMDHPNIAHVLDGGSTAGGRPYFVMDLVEGIPITDFCDQHQMPTEARLHLFMQLCAGVQHAHLKGVIHRDLKPTNVLVTLQDGKPVPKVIDFGVARAMGRNLAEQPMLTRAEQLIGTPAYMSPEQAEGSGLDIDTRSDIYSLGVLLYELLVGATPFDKEMLARAPLSEVRQIIRETEPPKPSTRLQVMGQGGEEVARRRHTAPSTLRRQVHGDLDWIVMMALEKDRNRRYETVNALARDVERHLNGEPVAARPPSNTYRAAKFVRRHRLGVLATAGVALALMAGLVLALVGFAQARRSSRDANQMAAIAQAINDFLQLDLLNQASPENTTNRNITLREVVDRAAVKIKGRFTNQPLVEAAIQATLGSLYTSLEEYGAAEPHARRAVELKRLVLGPYHPETLAALTQLAVIYANQGLRAEGAGLMRQVAENGRRALDLAKPKDLECLHFAGQYWQLWARPDEAFELLQLLREKEQRLWGPEDWHLQQTTTRLAALDGLLGRHSEAASLSEEVLRVERQNPGWHLPQVLEADGAAWLALGDYSKAAGLWKEGLDLARRRWTSDSDYLLHVESNLSFCYGAMGQWENCAALEREMIQSSRNPELVLMAGLHGAVAALLAKDTNAYRQFAARELALFGATTNAAWARIVGEVCFLMPDSVPDLQPVFKLAESVPPARVWDQVAKGLAEYRCGNLGQALELFDGPRQATGALASQAGYYCAMIHYRLGNLTAAQTDLEEAGKRLSAVLHTGELGEAWHEYGRAAVARAEAEKLILGRQVAPFADASLLNAARTRWAPVRRHLNTADRLAAQMKWAEASAEYQTAIREPVFDWKAMQSSEAYLAFRVGIVFLLAKDYQGYEEHCRRLWLELEYWPDSNLAYHTLKSVLARDLQAKDHSREKAAQWLQAFQAAPGQSAAEGAGLVPAMAAYRWGRYDDAVGASRAQDNSRLALKSAAQIYRAMSLAKLGRATEGRRELQAAETRLAPHLKNLTGDFWWDLGLCRLALDEAHRLLGRN